MTPEQRRTVTLNLKDFSWRMVPAVFGGVITALSLLGFSRREWPGERLDSIEVRLDSLALLPPHTELRELQRAVIIFERRQRTVLRILCSSEVISIRERARYEECNEGTR